MAENSSDSLIIVGRHCPLGLRPTSPPGLSCTRVTPSRRNPSAKGLAAAGSGCEDALQPPVSHRASQTASRPSPGVPVVKAPLTRVSGGWTPPARPLCRQSACARLRLEGRDRGSCQRGKPIRFSDSPDTKIERGSMRSSAAGMHPPRSNADGASPVRTQGKGVLRKRRARWTRSDHAVEGCRPPRFASRACCRSREPHR